MKIFRQRAGFSLSNPSGPSSLPPLPDTLIGPLGQPAPTPPRSGWLALDTSMAPSVWVGQS